MFAFFTAQKFSVRAQVGTLAVLCALCLVWRTVAFAVLHQEAVYFHTRFDSILFGCILAIAMNPVVERVPAWVESNIGWLASLGFGLIGATIAFRSNVFRETLRYSVQGVALAPIMLFVLLRSKGWIVRALEHPVMTFLRRSYAMYLIHLCLLETVSIKFGISMRAACFSGIPPGAWLRSTDVRCRRISGGTIEAEAHYKEGDPSWHSLLRLTLRKRRIGWRLQSTKSVKCVCQLDIFSLAGLHFSPRSTSASMAA